MISDSALPSLPGSLLSDVGAGRLRVGIDIVQISQIRASLDQFGDRFARRLFTADEISYAASSPALEAERFAARFAAKEAAIKAFGLSEAGLDWRDLEVIRRDDGSCRLALHRGLAEKVGAAASQSVSLSSSHDGDYATAIVIALVSPSHTCQP